MLLNKLNENSNISFYYVNFNDDGKFNEDNY